MGGLIKFFRGPMVLLKDEYARLGSVFTVSSFPLPFTITFLVGPEVSSHFFKAHETELSQKEVYQFNVPTFGRGVVFDVDYSIRMEQFRFFTEALKISRFIRKCTMQNAIGITIARAISIARGAAIVSCHCRESVSEQLLHPLPSSSPDSARSSMENNAIQARGKLLSPEDIAFIRSTAMRRVSEKNSMPRPRPKVKLSQWEEAAQQRLDAKEIRYSREISDEVKAIEKRERERVLALGKKANQNQDQARGAALAPAAE